MRVNGDAIRVIRERSGLTQTAFAGMVGIDRSHLTHIEAGRRRPSPPMAARIADELCVPMTAILAPAEP